MDRRSFLGGSLALAGSLLVVPVTKVLAANPVPTIWGDGIHDDSPGLQALFDGEPFITSELVNAGIRSEVSPTNAFINLFGGLFYLKNKVIIGRKVACYAQIYNCVFLFDSDDRTRYYLHTMQGRNEFVLGDFEDDPYKFPVCSTIDAGGNTTISNCTFRSLKIGNGKSNNTGWFQEVNNTGSWATIYGVKHSQGNCLLG